MTIKLNSLNNISNQLYPLTCIYSHMCICIWLVLIKTLGLKTNYFEGLGLIKYFQVHLKTCITKTQALVKTNKLLANLFKIFSILLKVFVVQYDKTWL